MPATSTPWSTAEHARSWPIAISGDEATYRLASAVLEKAVKNWNKTIDRKSLIRFFMSDTFEMYCDMAHINPEWLLNCLKIKWKYIKLVPIPLASGQEHEGMKG